ncbi:MAG: DUF6306 domain-containing protein [Pseudomonadota bacterium]|jgi:hypothetical protein
MSLSEDLNERLVVLLEAERAGVVVAKNLLAQSGSEAETELFEAVLQGEKEGCRTLGKAIRHLGFTGSGNVGAFVRKVMDLPGKRERLELLVRGQEWVVRKIDEIPLTGLPLPDREDLEQVREDHLVNIRRCKEFLEGEGKEKV